MENFYCAASAEQTEVSAVVRLPTPIRGNEYEVRLVCCTFVPNWEAIPDLSMTVTNDESEELILFTAVYAKSHADVIRDISTNLRGKYGFNKESIVRLIVNEAKRKIYLKKNTKIKFSKPLASLLGTSETLENSTNNTRSYPVKIRLPTSKIENNVYYISCDQLPANFVSPAVNGINVMDIVQVHDSYHDQLVEHFTPNNDYLPFCDESLLSTVYIRLLNSKGEHISTIDPQFYVLLQFKKNGSKTGVMAPKH